MPHRAVRPAADASLAPPLMRRELTEDGIHPLAAGYARMAPVARAAIATALVAKTKRTH